MWSKLENSTRFLPSFLVKGLCTIGPVGYWGKGPGTNGSLIGLALYTILFFPQPILGEVLLLVVLTAGAILLCGEGEKRLQKRDPGEIILDEVVAVPLCFLGLKTQMIDSGFVWLYMIAGFGLFRLFDIIKPLGIRRLQKYPGGLGVVLDDLAAAIAVNVTLRLFTYAFAHGGW